MSRGRMSVLEIAKRLSIGKRAVYTMLEKGIVPSIRIGRRWLITTAAFTEWERTCESSSRAYRPGIPSDRRRSPGSRWF